MIKGDQVAVYQDTYLELIENDSTNNSKMQTNQLDDSIQNLSLLGLRTTAKADKKKSFNVNRPFVFIFEINHQIVALGRIKDPHWCKFCMYVIITEHDRNLND